MIESATRTTTTYTPHSDYILNGFAQAARLNGANLASYTRYALRVYYS